MTQARRVSAIIKYDNKDISADLMPYVKNISYRDAMSGQADDLQLTLEDRQGLWQSAWMPELESSKNFVIYANAKGMLIAPDVAQYFCDAHNPAYNAEAAAKDGYRMFCQPGMCPFDLLKYGMHKGLLTDVRLPFDHGKELLQDNWDFIARYYLSEYYEGG